MKKLVVLGVAILSLMLFTGNSFAFLDDNSVDNSTNANANAISDNTGNFSNSVTFPETKDVTTSRVDAKGYRGFNAPTEMNYPGMPAYFGNAVPGSSFQSCKTALIYKDTFTASELTLLAKDPFGSKVIVTPLVKEVADKDKAEFMKMMLRKPGEDLKVEIVGYITVKATGKNTVSMEVLAEAALAARDLGANVIHITAEGVDRELKAFGWGVGLSYTRASISDTEQGGAVAAGGTGISGGSAGYVDMPWFQVFALKVQ
jgi:hypothetical protein